MSIVVDRDTEVVNSRTVDFIVRILVGRSIVSQRDQVFLETVSMSVPQDAMAGNTAISTCPYKAAKCKDVLLLSLRLGFWSNVLLPLSSRFTRERSFTMIASRSRFEGSACAMAM